MNSKQRKKLLKKGPSAAAFNIAIGQFLRQLPAGYDVNINFKQWLRTKHDRFIEALTFDPEGFYLPYLDFERILKEEIDRRFEEKMLLNKE